MKRGIVVFLALLVLLACTSCFNSSRTQDIPEWIVSKTWRGTVSSSVVNPDGSKEKGSIDFTFTASSSGRLSLLGKSGLVTTIIANDESYEIEIVSKDDLFGTFEDVASYRFSRLDDTSCRLTGTRVYTEKDSFGKSKTTTTDFDGILTSNQ